MNDIKTLEGTLRTYPYVAAAYLFGSRARGNAGPTSDVDIAVLLKEGAPAGRALVHEMGYLAYKIGKVIGAREVDLVELNGKGLVFQHNVLRAGRL
ncbi:MAG: nucleotidyltransferase domain-containing protein, partial [Deltaproteobacteria bacterium]|nr:nucleotidyltransferase domain-containing protein [Deltaproteobacteria bacterium]